MKKLLFLIPLLFCLISYSQTRTYTYSFPPNCKDSLRITFTITASGEMKADYIPVTPVNNNKPPVASAGADVSITLPTNTITLSAVASSDPDGDALTYTWSKLSGGNAVLTSVNTALNVSQLLQGTYVFRVTVTDKAGLFDTDDVNVVVLPAVSNPEPTPGYTLIFERSLDALESGDNPSQVGQGSFVSFDGRKVFKSLVYGDSRSNVSSGYRSEIQYGSSATPSEGAVEYDAYYENWTSFSGGGSGVQWHPCQSGPSAFLLLGVSTGKFDMARSINGNNYYQSRTGVGTLMTIPKNTWVKHRVEYKFATSGGYARHYVNGVLVYSETNVQTTTTGCQYLKLGQNRWNVVSGQNTVIYFDQLKVYKKN